MRTVLLWGLVAFGISMMFGCAEMPQQANLAPACAPAAVRHAVFLREFQDAHSQSRGAAL